MEQTYCAAVLQFSLGLLKMSFMKVPSEEHVCSKVWNVGKSEDPNYSPLVRTESIGTSVDITTTFCGSPSLATGRGLYPRLSCKYEGSESVDELWG